MRTRVTAISAAVAALVGAALLALSVPTAAQTGGAVIIKAIDPSTGHLVDIGDEKTNGLRINRILVGPQPVTLVPGTSSPLFTHAAPGASGPNAIAPTQAVLTGCEFSNGLTRLSIGQAIPCQLDNLGRLIVTVGASAPIQATPTDASGLTAVFDPCQRLQKIVGANSFTTNTQIIAGSSGKRIGFCAWNDQNAGTAQNYAVVEGTGGNSCPTNLAAVGGLSGGTTAATGWNVAANGGRSSGNGGALFAATATAGNNVCVLISGSTQVNVGYAYVLF